MQKLITCKVEKIWGYEIWLHSPLKICQTKTEDGVLTTKGPLVKIIKTKMPLSIQVHPDDDFAFKLENSKHGKSESWYVLACGLKSQLVLGLKSYRPDLINQMIEEKTFEENLKIVDPKTNHFYNIPAGLVHGIGENMEIFEVQQASDITYRYWDYDRYDNGKPRELHLEKALLVQKDLSWKIKPSSIDPLTYKTSFATQIFGYGRFELPYDAIVVNLNTFEAYLAKEGEVFNFVHYAVVKGH